MDEKKTPFIYTYSSSRQQEIKHIRKKYAPPTQEDKMERLRRLDASVTRPGTIAALIVGIISTLILGVGMCCTLVWADTMFIQGVVIGVIGIAGVIAAYPIYTRVTKKQREKLAPEIMRLSDELLK